MMHKWLKKQNIKWDIFSPENPRKYQDEEEEKKHAPAFQALVDVIYSEM